MGAIVVPGRPVQVRNQAPPVTVPALPPDLAVIAGRPLAGALPAGAARLSRADFLVAARAGLSPAFGGSFGAAAD